MFTENVLKNKVAIITGAGRGIGKAIALAFAKSGADTVLAARTINELEGTANEIKKFGRQALVVPTDVSCSNEVDILIDQAIKKFSQVDILVNNAGQLQKHPVVFTPDFNLQPPKVPKEIKGDLSDQEWNKLLAVNLNSVFYCCRAVGRYMLPNKQGKIINISSNNAIQAYPLMAAYNCSKAAVNMLTRVLALEWSDYNICVNALAPGEYHTTMTDFSWSNYEERKKRLRRIPLHRSGDWESLTNMAIFLASTASDYITGQIIYVDGGLTAV